MWMAASVGEVTVPIVGQATAPLSCEHRPVTTAALDFYATPGRHTDVRELGLEVADAAEAVEIVQGLLVYDMLAKDLYDADLTDAQTASIHLRDASELLALASTVDERPLREARPPGSRIGGRCNTFAVMTVALLRSAGIPARSRCGFGTYFVEGWHEDHWVAEYWDADDQRWVMIDAQLDDAWRRLIGSTAEAPVEVGPTEFVTGGHAWQAYRRGDLDPGRCGLTSIPEHGGFWIAGNLRLDFAALNKVEMLPWDLWGLFWEPEDEPPADAYDVLDEIAALTVDPDARFDELSERYQNDTRFRMDGTVFSVALGDFVTL